MNSKNTTLPAHFQNPIEKSKSKSIPQRHTYMISHFIDNSVLK